MCSKLVLLCFFLFSSIAFADEGDAVTYDKRSLLINGSRELLFSGSIHYPRSTPDMWPALISKAKHGGINVIDTYVFWNIHEPVEGQYNFNGRYDLVKFLKVVQEQGLYVILRIGPFVESEWNYGGFPYWLRQIPGIIFRSNNKPFKTYMKKYAKMIVNKMKDEKMYAGQGGPIILTQIENEYNMVQLAFKEKGLQYVQWAAKMAVGLKTGVPWIMCKQKDAPDPVINTCNGRNCGDTFTGPNAPNKPSLWTENWTAQYRVFGDPPSQRSAEDIAFAVARWFSKDGTLVNYYMYHGGTNFGRTGSSFVTTRYYDEAPIDEYGMLKEPKWGHLRDLHSALRLCRKALFRGNSYTLPLGSGTVARVYEKPGTNICAAFITNNQTRESASVVFRNVEYFLPPHSISILPDCKTVVFNTAKVNAQHNARSFYPSDEANKNMQWKMYQEKVPKLEETSFQATVLLEHLNMTRDTTDYLWYTTTFEVGYEELSTRSDIRPVIQIASLGHALHAFVNGQYIGSGHGTNIDKSFTFSKAIALKSGDNEIALLGMTVGLPNSGAYLEHKLSGIHAVQIQGLNSGMKDLSDYNWGYQTGMLGENLHIYKQRGTQRVDWSDYNGNSNQAVTWYKRYFDAPAGRDPIVIDMSSMGKGQVWVNGDSIGRYWVSYLTPLGKPSQALYHIPRSFVRTTENFLVVFEESGGDPSKITIATAVRDTICSFISESHPAHVKSWKREDSEIRTVEDYDMKPVATLKCPNHKVIQTIEFASFGNPIGVCGNYTLGNCNAPATKSIIEKACVGKMSCTLPVLRDSFGQDPCPESSKVLAVQARCIARGGDGPDIDDAINKY